MIIRRPMAVVSLLFMLIVFLVLEISGGVDITEYEKDGKRVSLTGVITDKVYKNNQYSIYLKDVRFDDRETHRFSCVIAYLKDDFDSLLIGQTVKINGEYNNFLLPENEGQFDSRMYYRIRGYECSIKKAEIVAVSKGYGIFKNFLYERKEITKSIFYNYMSDDEAGTLSAMVLGDKSGLDRDVKDLYQNAGISHVLSLSGLHIATVGLFLFSILFKVFKRNGIASILSSVIMISYALMTGMSTSTKRALIMFMLGILANYMSRTYDLLSAVYLSSILILFESPYYIYDSGFLLSFSAVFGIGILYPMFNELFDFKKEVHERIDKIRQGIFISISTSLSTLPVVMDSFYKLSRFSILINIFVVPLMGVILFLGIVAGFIGNIILWIIKVCGGKADNYSGTDFSVSGGIITGALGYITRTLLFFAEKILELYNVISKIISDKHVNIWVVGKGNFTQYVVYIILILTICFMYKNILKDKRKGIRGMKRIALMKLRAVVIIGFIIAVVVISYRKKPELRINVLSVGQGACNVIYGKDIPVILVDAGSTDVKEVYRYKIEPFLLSNGIDHIDYAFITHPDADHISGIKEFYENENTPVSIGKIFMSVEDAELCKLTSERSTENLLDESGTDSVYEYKNDIYDGDCAEIESEKSNTDDRRIVYLQYGDRIKNNDILIEVLSPENVTYNASKNDGESDLNDLSLVLKMTHLKSGYTALFTGDISAEVEKKIIEKEAINNVSSGALNERMMGSIIDEKISKENTFKIDQNENVLENIDFMTVAHHGSKYSSSEEFIKTVNPRIATISSGKGNSYGHPHAETLDRLNKYTEKALILRTDTCGQISVELRGGKAYVSRYSMKVD